MSREDYPDLGSCKMIVESEDRARIVDIHNNSIATVRTSEDVDGRHFSRVVFRPDVAHRIVKALDLAAAIDAFTGKDEA